ncbi:gamma-glutamyl-gamma-aminobutyrate hydrolase family protein [Intrasporangium sp.]|uniref:gamma-glutamyl-gamma-aminobutyrate hydrolase family protein n=1 Tax=Intrasporangium sp. TaxID=1925024 RepID=UPI00293A5087|nr:gamma-glutamyl-gamma-aminobutyrate hydrolase family protein [Intrasporangium sp.]MDV3223345.1 gamma-glutamyl-gamma-aminobutyrate hydrolase family protein [Intrasporangium sp.]
MSDTPIIGITSYLEPTTQGIWVDVPSALIPHSYVRKVEEAGGIAVLIPPRLDSADDDHRLVRALLGRLDGVIIAGGVDVAPELYAAARHPTVQASRPDRDTTELAIAQVSSQLDLPVLGICRGMQVMAVAAGGTLEQHVPERVAHDDHAPAPATYGSHPVDTVAGTRIADLLGSRVGVPSYHHQSVATHPGYLPAAWAPDGTLEAMEDPLARFRLAVQWHPEEGEDPRLFQALIAAARAYAARLGRARG